MPILNWLNKEYAVVAAKKSAYRLLQEIPDLSYGIPENENLLIQGDNLEALKALIPFYAGKVQCIFIDPPYNTKSAFEHYDDNLEHSKWLSLMYPRLELLRELLHESGSIWVSLDDNEAHYCKVIMDEVFGRSNFVSNCLWEKVYSERMDAKGFSTSHDHILVYQKSSSFVVKQLPKEQKKSQFNFFDDVANKYYRRRSLRKEGSESLRKHRPSMWYPITAPDGTDVFPVKPDGTEGRWRWKKENVLLRKTELDYVKKESGWEIYVKQYQEEEATRPPATWFPSSEVGHNHEAKLEVKDLNSQNIFDTPKPERLISRILQIASDEGDIVLDSFLGSGTTAAVAHKMKRNYIGIEIGEHAVTHCQPRMIKVVEGKEGGISKAVNWQGGGGFRFYHLGECVFDEYGCLNTDIKFPTLASHIWYLETKTPLGNEADNPLLGVHNDTAYYLLYNGIVGDRRPAGGNVLTSKVLNNLPDIDKHERIVIYGESSRLGEARLKQANITFKQIPYDVGTL